MVRLHLNFLVSALIVLIMVSVAEGVPVRTDTVSDAITTAPLRPERPDANAMKPPPPARHRPDTPAAVSPGHSSPTVPPADVGNSSANASTGGGSDAGASDGKAKDPCKRQCKPSIDKNHSVIAAFGLHRAQAALIGDYGKGPKACSDDNKAERANNATHFTWTVDWGDEESYTHREETVWPYQTVHEYHKKGKYKVDITFCHHLEGCEPSCAKHKQVIHVKP